MSGVETACRVGRQLARDPWGNIHPVLPITRRDWDALLEYSATLPSGKTPGKRWKRAIRGATGEIVYWVVGEYDPAGPDADNLIDINWHAPVIDGGKPGEARP